MTAGAPTGSISIRWKCSVNWPVPLATESGYCLNMTDGKFAGSKPLTREDLLDSAASILRSALPERWEVDVEPPAPFEADADARMTVKAPDGSAQSFGVLTKSSLATRDIPALKRRGKSLMARADVASVVIARYLAPVDRARLIDAGLFYIDATRNMKLWSSAPAFFVSDRGADSDPWRGPGRPRGTLKGEPAAKVVRALADFAEPWRVRELAEVSGASVGSVYRVMQFLEEEELAERLPDRRFSVPDWTVLLKRWSEDYQLLRINTVSRWIAPRGMSDLLDTVRGEEDVDYAMTGSVAAAAWAEYAPARSATVYVRDIEGAAAQWGLRQTEVGANVLLVKPAYPVVMDRPVTALEGLKVASPTQVAVDLMTGPGRSPAEAEELIDWMRRNEKSWR